MLSEFSPFLFTCALSIGVHNLHLIFNFRYIFSLSFVELVTFCALRDSRFRLLRMFALLYFLFNCGKFSHTHTQFASHATQEFSQRVFKVFFFSCTFSFFCSFHFRFVYYVCVENVKILLCVWQQRSAPVTYKEHTPSGCVCLVYLCFAEDDGALWLGRKLFTAR